MSLGTHGKGGGSRSVLGGRGHGLHLVALVVSRAATAQKMLLLQAGKGSSSPRGPESSGPTLTQAALSTGVQESRAPGHSAAAQHPHVCRPLCEHARDSRSVHS